MNTRTPAVLPVSATRVGAAAVATTITLFLWSGFSQVLPWGVPAVRNYAQTTHEPKAFGANPVRKSPGELVTPEFDAVLGRGISTLATDQSFAWIISVPGTSYDPALYFLGELGTQSLTACMLVLIITLTQALGRRRRLAVTSLFAASAAIATYGVMANWWGLPFVYAGGMSVNLVVGWLLGTQVAERILRMDAVRVEPVLRVGATGG